MEPPCGAANMVIVRVTNGAGPVTNVMLTPGRHRTFEMNEATALQCATLAVHLKVDVPQAADSFGDVCGDADNDDGGFFLDDVFDGGGAAEAVAWAAEDKPCASVPVCTTVALQDVDLGAVSKVLEFARYHTVMPFRPTQWPVTTASFESLFADEFDRAFFDDTCMVAKATTTATAATTTLAALVHAAEVLGVGDLCHLAAVKLATLVRGGQVCAALQIAAGQLSADELALVAADYPRLTGV